MEPPPDVDLEVWGSLPDDIRQELITQHQNTLNAANAAATAPATTTTTSQPYNEQDMSVFLATLDPELRNQVLLTMPPETVQQMNEELRNEVERIRHRAAVEQNYGGGGGNNLVELDEQRHRTRRGNNTLSGHRHGSGKNDALLPIPGDGVLMTPARADLLVKIFEKAVNQKASLQPSSPIESVLTLLSLQPDDRKLILKSLMNSLFRRKRPLIATLQIVTELVSKITQVKEDCLANHLDDLFRLLTKLSQTEDEQLDVAILNLIKQTSEGMRSEISPYEQEGLTCLSKLLSWNTSETIFTLASAVAKNFVSNDANRADLLLRDLVNGTEELGAIVAKELDEITARLRAGGSAEDEPVTASELKLLRVVKTIKNLSSKHSQLAMSTDWKRALGQALKLMGERVSKEVVHSKRGGGATIRPSPTAMAAALEYNPTFLELLATARHQHPVEEGERTTRSEGRANFVDLLSTINREDESTRRMTMAIMNEFRLQNQVAPSHGEAPHREEEEEAGSATEQIVSEAGSTSRNHENEEGNDEEHGEDDEEDNHHNDDEGGEEEEEEDDDDDDDDDDEEEDGQHILDFNDPDFDMARRNERLLGLIMQEAVEAVQLTAEDGEDDDEEEEPVDEEEEEEEEEEEHDFEELTPNSRPRPPHSSSKQLIPGLSRFVPCIEAYFDATDDDTILEQFGNEHALVLNALVRNSPALLNDSLNALVTKPGLRRVLTFENKKHYFKTGMRQLNSQHRAHTIRLVVKRDRVFEDSLRALKDYTAEEMRGHLTVTFKGEEGIDAGGVLREWYVVLIRAIFTKGYALFKKSDDSSAFQPDPRSYMMLDHLSLFKFVGRVIGKAVADGHLVAAHFTRSFYKHILGREISLSDLQSLDFQYHKSLMYVLENDVSGMEIYFTLEVDEFGVHKVIELCKDGAKRLVTEENKLEWVNLCAQQKMHTSIQKQIDAFLQGFYELVPKDLVRVFNPQELELLISGLPKIDLEDLIKNSEYRGGYASDSPQIEWFWKVLKGLGEEDLARFLMFVTGTSQVPLEGFANLQGMRGTQKFSIQRGPSQDDMLPCAHTCFNQLDLPCYSTEEILTAKLTFAIREGSETFGFG